MSKLPITEELDFAYLLEIMATMHNVPGFAWLPELFSIVGAEKLITLCKYAGGECITIPTLDQLYSSIEALQYFYDVKIKRSKTVDMVPAEIRDKFEVICNVYSVNNGSKYT